MTTTHVAGRYAGKAAVITGAGSGIGQATALRLAAEGAHVLGLDINAEGLATTAARADAGIETRQCDIADPAQCRAAIEDAVERFGRLDVLGNVAGIARADHLQDVTEAAYRQMMGVNVDGYFFMAQAAIPHLLHEGGAIVNIASNAGIIGQAYTVVYCMTKGAVIQLTRALAMEYLKTPLRVVAIAPGMVDTGLTRGYQMPADVDWDLVGRYISPRGATPPETIAALFAFLASGDAPNMHGAIVSADHGMTTG
ncbi:MAG: meso-butanediol dehydrogenase / (S,S)-butanediol dehydrogenase / diacetyl reductase [Frankiaceae bacterium]|nr:meso-butanediol dehydrogenase / (S,S)-butanediol dehydrogenase / diacetyl reductase [Frankiaceae bacterium]